eukprot:15439652-Alexandrium_andersonii.AAC.1
MQPPVAGSADAVGSGAEHAPGCRAVRAPEDRAAAAEARLPARRPARPGAHQGPARAEAGARGGGDPGAGASPHSPA